MKSLIKVEEAAQFVAALVGLYLLPLRFEWYQCIMLFLLPDISMLGYLINPRVGALSYNLFHHKAIGIGLFLTGWFANEPYMQFTGILLFGHSAFDRMLGYGLKLPESFHYTHLGMIGKEKRATNNPTAEDAYLLSTFKNSSVK